MSKSEKWLCFFLALLCLNLLLLNGQVTLWDEDEAAYAGFAYTMLESGNWVQPEFLWSRIHRKTPLHFWNIALSYKVFGVSEWTTRLSSTLAVLMTCIVLLKWGASVFGERVSKWASIVLATSLIVPLTGKVALTDATLLLFQTSAVLALFNYLKTPNWKWNLYFWISISLGILTKGPLIIILCGGLWLFLALFHPNRKTLVGTHPWIFGFCSLIPTGIWLYTSWQQDNGELVNFLYDWYVVKRVGGSVLGQSGLPGYHFVVLLIAFIPWLAFLFSTLAKQFKYFRKKEDDYLLLSGWLLFGWLFFELMRSKLPSYALAAHPAIALLIGREIISFLDSSNNRSSKSILIPWLFSCLLILAIAIGAPFAIYTFFDNSVLLPYFCFASVMLLMLGIQFFTFFKKRKEAFVYSLAMTGGLLLFLTISCLAPVVERSPMKSLNQVAITANEMVLEKGISNSTISVGLVSLGNKQTKVSLAFYIGQYFKNYEAIYKEEALERFLSEKPSLLIVNEEVLLFFKEALRKKGRKMPEVKTVQWWSTDDKLRRHDYFMLMN
ncbi:MAG: 4-amino-4-deoxy-L-arabinose transferase-like glycosyltransferase [Polaribacter sp.]|jgi:4-amino-4-deoxy-L-arabinose transferase-like glycosyltransferase